MCVGGDNCVINANLWTPILSKFQTVNDLFVNELCADLILFAIMPRGEDLLAKGETPGGVLFLPAAPFYFLFTL